MVWTTCIVTIQIGPTAFTVRVGPSFLEPRADARKPLYSVLGVRFLTTPRTSAAKSQPIQLSSAGTALAIQAQVLRTWHSLRVVEGREWQGRVNGRLLEIPVCDLRAWNSEFAPHFHDLIAIIKRHNRLVSFGA